MESKIIFGEMSILDILTQSFKSLFSKQWWRYFLICLIVFSPLLIWKLLLLFIGKPEIKEVFSSSTGSTRIHIQMEGIGTILNLIILQPLATAAILKIIVNSYLGEPVTIGATLRFAIGKLPKLIGPVLLSGLAILGGIILCIIPGIFMVIFFIFVSQVVVMEGLGGIKTLERSKSLTRDHRWRIVRLWIWLFVIGSIVIQIPIEIVEHALELMPMKMLGEMTAASLSFSIETVLFGAFSTIATALLYLDIRKKKEEFDLAGMSDGQAGLKGI